MPIPAVGAGPRRFPSWQKTQTKAHATKRPAARRRAQFTDVKSAGKPFKGVAKEPDKRK
jgi:hypothetical protein